MSDGKSKFVDLLLNFADEEYNPETGMPSKAMISSKKKPNFEFIFSTKDKVAITKKTTERIRFFNMMDGFQFIECGLPSYGQFNQSPKWTTTAQGFTKKIQSIIDQECGFSSLVYSKQTNVLAFDNGRNVCPAKKPTQNARRMAKIIPSERTLKDPEKVKKIPIVIFPFEHIDQFIVRDHDFMPSEWRKFMTFGLYKNKIINYLCEKLMVNSSILLKNPNAQKMHLWMNGVFTSLRAENLDVLNEKFHNMGEFDFFAIRYMNYIICKNIEKKNRLVGHQKTTKEKSLYDFSTIHDFETLVFKIHSNDTDLLLYSLYFLEFIKYKYSIHDSFLPKIIIVHPRSDGSTYHVTYMYMAIKHQLERVNNRQMATTMRSFIMALVSWGNDILPNPNTIVPDVWIKTYVQFNHLIDHSFVFLNPKPKDPRYANSCIIKGSKFRLMHLLAYAVKHLKPDQIDKIWEFYDPRQKINKKELEKYIITEINGKPITAYAKKLNLQKKAILLPNRTLRSRLILSAMMLYSIEHALEIVPGSDTDTLSQFKLPESCFLNRWPEFESRVDPILLQKANTMGLITSRNCIYFSDDVQPLKSADEEMLRLLKYAEMIFDMFHFGTVSYNIHIFRNPAIFEIPSCSDDVLLDDE